MKKIAVFTGTRADYGLLYWLFKDIQASHVLDLQLLVSGMHLSPEFGLTRSAILADGFKIDAQVEMLLSSDSPVGVVKSMGVGLIGFADALDRMSPDCLVVLGDRFEALAVAQAALVLRIPIVHLHGGEKTEGAYDDAIRHAITKMANLHFVAAESYRNRVIQMGEDPATVLNVGALGLDHLMRSPRMNLLELSDSLACDLRQPFFLVTYHPVTAGNEPPETTMAALLSALETFPDHQILITYPNADNGGRAIIAMIEAYAQRHPDRVCAVPSLGSSRYLAALSLASAVVGNSSSGIIEAPAYRVPTVDIGVRQAGRLTAESVVHAAADQSAMSLAIYKVLTAEHRLVTARCANPYGAGRAAESIVRYLEAHDIPLHKEFHDRH
jgi:UDP-N-acetylglucosamine 2-epimerase (non-hydrolysing)